MKGLLPVILIACCCLTAAAQDRDQIVIEPVAVGGTVTMLKGSGGNIGVCAGPDGVFMIDDQFAPLTPKILTAVKALSDQPVKFVINTHYHGDHTGGNENLAKAGAIVVAHHNVRKRLSTAQFNAFFNRKSDPKPVGFWPVVTFTSDLTFHLNGDEITVRHLLTGAHTDGDAVVFFRNANVVHAGDTYFNGSYPYIDVSSGGSIDGVIATVAKILELVDDQTRIIPGHGELSNKAELNAYLEMLKGVRKAVFLLKGSGKSLDDAVAARPTQAYDGQWGQGFIKPDAMVKLTYSSLP